MASTYLTRTPTTLTLSKYTMSFWVKRSKLGGSAQRIYSHHQSSTYMWCRFESNNRFRFVQVVGGNEMGLRTNRYFRDTNAWYHIVITFDTTQSTQSDRIKMWINGVQETSFDLATYPSQNATVEAFNSGTPFEIGRYHVANNEYFDGLLSHCHMTVGYAYPASTFGSTDSTTGEWQINTAPNVTYGTNGFFLLKDDNAVTDRSGQGNNFTLGGGTLTKTEDCPSNVFCTWNTNHRSTRKDMTLTNGNTHVYEQNSGDSAVSGTIGVSSGKWYWEQKATQVTGTNFVVLGGLHTIEDFTMSPTSLNQNNTVGMRDTGNVFKGTSDLGNFTSAVYNGDVFGIGFDADNGSMYFWRNGSALNSGNAIVTGLDMTKTWTPFAVQHGGARVSTTTNFGNGYFQTTAVSSAGTNASGIGIFEYDVPSGYTALSTKGLNE